MKDEGLTTQATLSTAEKAVDYLLQRIRVDADLRWLMLHTEAWARLCTAQAERTGEDLEVVRERYSRAAPHRANDRPRLKIYEAAFERIAELCGDWERREQALDEIRRIAEARQP